MSRANLSRIETDAVVLDLQFQVSAAAGSQRNGHASRPGVPLHVAQGFLRHPQNGLGAFVAKPRGIGVRGEFACQAGAIDESLDRPPYTTLALALAMGLVVGAMWKR